MPYKRATMNLQERQISVPGLNGTADTELGAQVSDTGERPFQATNLRSALAAGQCSELKKATHKTKIRLSMAKSQHRQQ